jgi:hypothetical protein
MADSNAKDEIDNFGVISASIRVQGPTTMLSRSFFTTALVVIGLVFAAQSTNALNEGTAAPADVPMTDADAHYRVLITGKMNGYPTDDDVTLIARYLQTMSDHQANVPDDVATWIVTKIGHLSPSATPRMIEAFVHFLRNGVKSPPFDAGPSGSARNRLLQAIAASLRKRGSPICELALVMFKEINDPNIRKVADSADYTALKTAPWAIGSEFTDWMEWIFDGLRPDSFLDKGIPSTAPQSPDWPVFTDQAKAALLKNARGFVATLNIQPPVTSSVMLFEPFTDTGGRYNWGRLGKGAPKPDWNLIATQNTAVAQLISHRVAATLGVDKIDDYAVYLQAASGVQQAGEADISWILNGYRKVLKLPDQPASQFPPFDDRFAHLCRVLAGQQWRLLALGSHGLLTYQRSHGGKGQDVAIDQVFSQLSSLQVAPSEAKTRVVNSFSDSEIRSVAGVDLASLAACKPKSVEVVNRSVVVQQLEYIETIKATCLDNSTQVFAKRGSLSTDLTRMTEINPNYLDIIGVSLGLRDLSSGNASRQENPDDIDLVRTDPVMATALNLALLAHPEVSRQYERDTLMQQWPIPIEWLTPGWRATPPALDLPLANGPVLLSSKDFEKWKQDVFTGEMNNLQAEARWRFYNAIWPVVDAMPDKIGSCDPITYLGSGLTCPNMKYTAKRRLASELNDIAREGNKYRKYSLSFADKNCDYKPIDKNYRAHYINSPAPIISLGINQDTNEFVSVYNNSCYAGVAGKVSLPEPMQTWLAAAIRQDPIFLNRYELDVVQSSDDWPTRIVPALTSAWQEATVAATTLRYLQSTDRLFYLPSGALPPAEWDVRATSADYRRAVLDVMTAPLLNSPQGKDLAEDLSALLHLYRVVPPALEDVPPQISKPFWDSLRAAEQAAIKNIDDSVDQQIASVKSSLSPQQSSGFEVGFTLGIGQSANLGFFFNYQGVGFTIPLTSFAPSIPSPALPDMPLPLMPILPSSANRLGGMSNIPVGRAPASVQDTGAQIGANPSTVETIIPDLNWQTLLAADNVVGRSWIENQLALAQHLLTPDQIKNVMNALQLPNFPVDLAKLLAAKAAEASGTSLGPLTLDPSVSEICKNDAWSTCGLVIKQELDKHPANPVDIGTLASLWGTAFGAQFDTLRRNGHLEKSVSEDERIDDLLNDHANPLEIAKDHAEDALLDKCFRKLPMVLFVINSTPVAAISTFFENLPEAASDYDELLLMDREIEAEVSAELAPLMTPTWKTDFSDFVDRAAPHWAPN